MKKIAIMLLAALMLTVFAAMPAFAAAEAPAEEAPSEEAPVDYSTKECYEFCEDAVIGFWLARVTLLSDNEWETSGGGYVSATFTAAKPFSAIKVPHWAGNPASFKGITPVDVEFAIFKAVENNWGSDYNSDDAVVREVKTFDHDDQEFIWEFPQQAAGRYCVRIMQLTEEGGYIVIAQGEPLDDDIEFDYEFAIKQLTAGKEGISLTVYYDEGPGPEVDPGEATAVPPTAAPTEAPTAAPTAAPTEAPTAAPTEAPAEPTEQAGEATEKPADDNKGNTEKDKKDNTWLIVGIVAAVVVVAAVACIAAIAAKKKKK